MILVNEAWRRFARDNNGGAEEAISRTDVGANYLQVCGQSSSNSNGETQSVYEGIKGVLDGARDGFTLEYPCHSPVGERWFLLYANPLPGGRGGAVISHVDITERKRAEARLREREELFSTLADSIPQLAWMADREGYIFWYNRRWYDYTGTTFEDMQGWGWQQVHDPKEVNRVTERFKRHLITGEFWEDIFPLRSRDGEYRWFLSRALPIRDAEGNIVRWFGTNTDVEEQRRVEQKLARINRERETLLEEVSTPIVPVWRDVLALPLIGSLDVERMTRATQTVLETVTRTGARLCIIDITAARIVDAQAVANLGNLVSALKLIGAEAAVAGVTAASARTLVQLGLDLSQMRTHRTLAEALAMFIKSHNSKHQGTGTTRNAVSKNFR
ncbi:MAG: PAS domain S-box protein [Pyrinomonadaceae bacterium]|nr:PAS domain S-box protein [Pyrinomonadaceae bacterium]